MTVPGRETAGVLRSELGGAYTTDHESMQGRIDTALRVNDELLPTVSQSKFDRQGYRQPREGAPSSIEVLLEEDPQKRKQI